MITLDTATESSSFLWIVSTDPQSNVVPSSQCELFIVTRQPQTNAVPSLQCNRESSIVTRQPQ